ncbi:GDSL-type esterase/lipase family protein [Lactobacillus sp. LL6]|uniref:SGNH/GDSL hydrolase family protein n=1 Tax=Lactobacillus sp. LL6 TaxID=2596827 RepID=UPI001186D309|nr:GDSL-type esterase/lipase family protein [Lactobacillus sp. LL6]TSO26839.1 SGNH/GDSL hydrolase family protein [Lactobacillus sp. LL6]
MIKYIMPRKKKSPIHPPIKNRWISGQISLNQLDSSSNLVVIEYGTNDASSGWGVSLKNYSNNLQSMIDYISPQKCIIVGPFPPDPNNFEINQFYQNIADFNQAAKHIAKQNHIPFINMISAFSGLSDISSYYQADGQHLTDKGNELLVKTIAPTILSKLKD